MSKKGLFSWNLGWLLFGVNGVLILANLLIYFLSTQEDYSHAKPILSSKDSIQEIQIQWKKEGALEDEFTFQLSKSHPNHLSQEKPLFLYRGETYSISQKMWEEFITKLQDIRLFTPLSKDKNPFGFSKGEYQIRIRTSQPSSPTVSFVLAKDTDPQGNSYMEYEGTVYLIPFPISPLNLRDPKKEFFVKSMVPENLTEADIQSIDLTLSGKTQYSLVQVDNHWFVSSRKDKPIEGKQFEEFWKSWKNLNASEIFFPFEKSKEWKQVNPVHIRITTKSQKDTPSEYTWNCDWEDRWGDRICWVIHEKLYFKFYSYDLNPIIQKRESDFIKE